MKIHRIVCLAVFLAGGHSPLVPVLEAQAAPEGGQSRHMDRRFDPRSSKSFDDPARDDWQKPDEVLAALSLQSGQVVADIGAGTGYFTLRLAKHEAAPKVYAVDIEASLLNHIRQRAEKESLSNVQAIQGSATSPNLPEPVDRVLMVNTYHHIAGRVGYFGELRKSLKPGALVAIIDWKKGGKMGPHREHRFTAGEITAELEKSGFERAAQHGFLPNQEFLVFRVAAPRN
jgi:cyclopropane fatty-acyl-phospholipid synthase-like methyltransferase